MATYRATAVSENPLCTRLQAKFQGRGASSAGTKYVAKTAAKVAKSKVVRNADPFEGTVEFVRAGAPRKTAQKASSARAYNAQTNVKKAYNPAMAQTTAFNPQRYAKAYARAASVREKAAMMQGETRVMNAVKPAKKETVLDKALAFVFGEALDEKTVKTEKLSKGVIISAIVIVMIVMLMLFSFAQINEFKTEISELENAKAVLQTTIQTLNVSLDSKNDIRMIEETATNDIGMVRSNQVTSKYISVSGGERVEVVENSEEAEEDFGVLGTLMSAIGTNWDHLMEYII